MVRTDIHQSLFQAGLILLLFGGFLAVNDSWNFQSHGAVLLNLGVGLGFAGAVLPSDK
jgi:hypothetical protein